MRFAAANPAPGYSIRPPCSWLEEFYPEASAYLDLWLRFVEVQENAVEAWSDLSLSEDEREEARQTYLALRDEIEAATVRAEDWRKENVERIRAERIERRGKRVAKILGLLDKVEHELREEAKDREVVAAISNDHRLKRDRLVQEGKLSLAGGNALSNLRRGVEAILPAPEPRRVSPSELARMKRDGEDTTGVRVTFGKVLPRGSYD